MKAVRVPGFGGAEVLEYTDVEEPRPGPGEVLIQVEAAGINYADVLMRFGMYPGGPKPPFLAGFEVAGRILDSGEGVDVSRKGQRVMALVGSGGYAERCVAQAVAAMPLPERFSPEEGAAFPVVFQTAYHALCTYGQAADGQTVLIHAAGGGVGTAAVQIARQLGLRIIATAGSDEKLERVRQLGADVLINYRETDFVPAVLEATGGRGCELILESVGGEVFKKSFKCLATMGRMVVYGIASGDLEIIHPRELLFNNHAVLGLHLMALARNAAVTAPAIRRLSQWVADGKLAPVVGHRFPLSEAAAAHRLMESRESYGKLVLLPGTETSPRGFHLS